MARSLPPLPGPQEPALLALPGRSGSYGPFVLHARRTPGTRRGQARAVYVHGLAGSSLNWTDLMHLLAPTLPGVALDLPGFGRSQPPPGDDYSLAAHSRALEALVEAEGGGRPVHLLGNSLGGALSVLLAVRRPDLVSGLTLISPALPVYRLKWTNVHMPLMLVPGVPGLMFRLPPAASPEARADLFIGMCWADPAALRPERRAEAVEEARRRWDLEHTDRAYVDSLRGLATGFVPGLGRDLWRAAARVQQPALLVFGGRDRLIDPSIAGRAARTFRSGEVVVLDHVGHVAQMEEPVTVAELVLDLVEGQLAS